VVAARSPAESDTRKQVQEYIAQIDALMAGNLDAQSDPTAFANKLLGDLSAGESSGLGELFDQARLARAGLVRIRPPAVCQEHYKMLSGHLDARIHFLEQVKRASDHLDTAALSGLAAQGKKLQEAAQHLEKMKNSLRSRFH
jgi:hypothetical protein